LVRLILRRFDLFVSPLPDAFRGACLPLAWASWPLVMLRLLPFSSLADGENRRIDLVYLV
jgi:hypothetical protein